MSLFCVGCYRSVYLVSMYLECERQLKQCLFCLGTYLMLRPWGYTISLATFILKELKKLVERRMEGYDPTAGVNLLSS